MVVAAAVVVAAAAAAGASATRASVPRLGTMRRVSPPLLLSEEPSGLTLAERTPIAGDE